MSSYSEDFQFYITKNFQKFKNFKFSADALDAVPVEMKLGREPPKQYKGSRYLSKKFSKFDLILDGLNFIKLSGVAGLKKVVQSLVKIPIKEAQITEKR